MWMPAHHRHHYGDDGYDDDDDDDDDHDHDDDGFFLFLHHIFVRFTSCQVYLSVRFTSLVQDPLASGSFHIADHLASGPLQFFSKLLVLQCSGPSGTASTVSSVSYL